MSVTDSNIRLSQISGKIRPPAVAGLFYPGNDEELEKMVSDLLAEARIDIPPPKAIIAPHAGYIYSGPTAAKAYASLKPVREKISRVILLGPAHRVHLNGLALSEASSFSTPLGNIKIDQDGVEKIRNLPQVTVAEAAHEQEHSLEVHLPFLQVCLDEFTLIPLVVGTASPEQVAEVLQILWGGEETLIVISSDLSHYHEYLTAQKIDTATSKAIEQKQYQEIGPHQACGCMPLNGLLFLAQKRNLNVRVIDQKNSGDTAGSHDRVVGYGAYSIDKKPGEFSQFHESLKELALVSIRQGFKTGKPYHVDAESYPQVLLQKRAVFVTLTKENNLRGCMGTLEDDTSLVNCVADCAFKAAFKDPRFKPLTSDEFDDIELGISILSKKASVEFSTREELLSQLRPGVDGLIIQKGINKATFLPAVWESLPAPAEFLNHLLQKAGIQINETPDQAWVYQTESF